MTDYPLIAGAAAGTDLPHVRDTIVVLENVTPADDLVISRLGDRRVGVRQRRADDGPTMPVFRLVLAARDRGFSLLQVGKPAGLPPTEDRPNA